MQVVSAAVKLYINGKISCDTPIAMVSSAVTLYRSGVRSFNTIQKCKFSCNAV